MPTIALQGVQVVLLSKIGDVELDLVDEVTVTHENLVTKNPTESGKNVSDNVVRLPVHITLSGRFVDTPLSSGGASFANPAQSITSALETGLLGRRSVTQWEALVKLRDGGQRFTVVVQQGSYANMVFRSLTAPRGKGDGGSMRFRAELEQLFIADESLFQGAATQVDESVEHTAPPSSNLGSQPTPVFQ